MKIINEHDFNHLLENEKELFVVSFYTNSCSNCTTLASIFNEVLVENKFKAFKINAENDYNLVKQFELLGVPTTLFYRHGFLVSKKLGVKSKTTLLKSIAKFQSFSKEQAEVYSNKSRFSKVLDGWLNK